MGNNIMYTVYHEDHGVKWRNHFTIMDEAERFADSIYDAGYDNVLVRDHEGLLVYKPKIILFDEL